MENVRGGIKKQSASWTHHCRVWATVPLATAASILSQPALCSKVRGVLQGMQQSMCSSLRFIYTYIHAGAVPACPVLAVLPVWWRTAFLRELHCAKAAFLSVS